MYSVHGNMRRVHYVHIAVRSHFNDLIFTIGEEPISSFINTLLASSLCQKQLLMEKIILIAWAKIDLIISLCDQRF